jgi:imidazolonepropionase-like amidohydrolase
MNKLHINIFIWLSLFSCSTDKEVYQDALCITNISTIDAVSGIQENMTVIIKDDRILRMAKSESFDLSSSNQIVDGTGKFMIPGLWDAHVHFAYIEELAPAMFDLFLAYGITSVRDTGGKIDFVKEWKDRALASPEDAPRVMIAGPLLDGMPNVYDGSTPTKPPLSLGANGVDEAIALVEKFDSVGVDLIKAYEMLTPEQFKAVTKIASQKGLNVTGHVPLSMDVISASNAGMNSMEHLRNLEMSCAGNWEELLATRRRLLKEGKSLAGSILRSNLHNAQRIEAIDNFDEETANNVLQVLAENETWQIPTLSIMTGTTNRPFVREEWKESFNYLPQSVSEKWNDGASRMETMPISDDQVKYSEWLKMMTGRVNDIGIDIMAGTDCPIFFLTPGLSLHEELRLLVESGLTPMEVLKTATLNPAKYFGLDNELGLIKEGFLADLVLLDANPIDDIENSKSIYAVIRNGMWRSRADLDQIFESLRQN